MNIFLNERINFDGKDWEPESLGAIENNLSDLLGCLKVLVYHLDCKLFYSAPALKITLDRLEKAAINSPVEMSLAITVLLSDLEAIDWTLDSHSSGNKSFLFQDNFGQLPVNITNSTISEAIEYLHEGQTASLLNFISSQYNIDDIFVNRVEIYPLDMKIYSLKTNCARNDLIDFINKNRIRRNFNLYEKHGENLQQGRWWRNGDWASPLKCSNHEAQNYLDKAIGVKGKTFLIGYDYGRREYIFFKYENVEGENSYHGYYPENQDENWFKSSKKYYLHP